MKRFSIRLGFIILGFNALVRLVGAVFFSLENVLCTSVSIYVNSSIINLVVTGLSQRKAVYIISPHWEKITHEIHEKIQRGVIILQCQGGHTGQKHQILYTVITFRELSRLK